MSTFSNFRISRGLRQIILALVVGFALSARGEPVLSEAEMLKDIAQARVVQVCKITPGPGGLMAGKFRTLGRAETKRLVGILTNPESYSDGPHKCLFTPAYEVAMSGRFGKLSIQFCFHCLDYKAELDGGVGQGAGSFDPSAATLKGIFEGLGLKGAE